MKKLIAILLCVLMLASLSVCAFAAPSPSQETEPAPEVVTPAATTEEELTEEEQAAIEEAEAAEAEVAETLEDATVEDDEDGNSVIVGLGKLPEDATESMNEEFAELQSSLVESKAALAEDEQAAIPEELVADAAEDAVLAAGQPFRAVASVYPATITIAVDDPASFVGMMVFVDGKWVKLNCTDNGDGTVTFVLDNPAVLSIVSSIEAAP